MTVTGKIEKVIRKLVDITVDTPYYFKKVLAPEQVDSVIVGKITDKVTISIHRTRAYNNRNSYEFCVDSTPHFTEWNSYLLDKQYKSSKREYDDMMKEMNLYIKKEAV